ncbi:MAG TPA: hypothetical protein VMX58_00870 [Patescibacteria group bacterium]|nr:hypothetical protein [Patescibacteria group bacterium]
MDEKLLVAITAAIEAYITSEERPVHRGFIQRLSRWKMATRRETMVKRNLTVRGDPHRVRLGRYSLM